MLLKIQQFSINPLVNEPYLEIKDIPNTDKGKQLWFWIVIKDRTFQINFSGLSTPISVSHPDFRDPNADLRRIIVSKTPLTIKRALIRKKISIMLLVMSTKMLENLTEVKEQSFKNNISKYYIMLVVEKKRITKISNTSFFQSKPILCL